VLSGKLGGAPRRGPPPGGARGPPRGARGGARRRVPTLEGEKEVRVRAGTQPGDLLRLRGQGLPVLGQRGRKGDQFIKLDVRLPRSLTPEQQRLLEQLRDELRRQRAARSA